ncbi:hypothetical protein HKD37_05G012639 [Glycine soja]
MIKEHALRCPYRTHARARVMGEVEEVQEQMKANMEAMKEQMATMMEAMMSMKKIMEANVVAVAATKAVAKVNPMPPSGLNQMNHPTLAMAHKMPHHNLADFEPCLGYATEGQAVGDIPLQNTLEGPQYHPQPHPSHSTAIKNPHAMEEMGKWRDLAAQVFPLMTKKEVITMIVDILLVFYYGKWWVTHLQALQIWSSLAK